MDFPQQTKKIMFVAGEASGDQRAAEVAQALLSRNPKFELFGIGGPAMRRAGVKTLIDINQLAVMGFIEVIKHLPRIIKIFKKTKILLKRQKPDLLILIDYPGFNLRLASIAKQFGIKVLFYISPQIWAWRQNRVKKIAKLVDHMAVIFPFEKQFYQSYDVPVTYVGHPLTQKIKTVATMIEAREKFSISSDQNVITLLPGSRKNEVDSLLPVMLESAEKLNQKNGNVIFLLAVASIVNVKKIEPIVEKTFASIKIIVNDSLAAINAANIIITASGTATLETALLHKPMVVVYKVNPFTAIILKRMLKIPYISLCNIVAGEKVVKELLQNDVNAENISEEVSLILQDKNYRKKIVEHLQKLTEKLGDMNAADNVAEISEKMLEIDSESIR